EPVLFSENKLLYGKKVVLENGLIDDFEMRYLGRGSEGDDVPLACLSLTGFSLEQITLYTYGGMAPFVMQAARELLLEEEISVRLILPAEIHPMPRHLLADAWDEGSAVLAGGETN